MPEPSRRIDLRFGEIAISAEGFDDPVGPVKQVLRFVQRLVEETPEMTGAAVALSDSDVDRLVAEVAERMRLPREEIEAVPGLILSRRAADAREATSNGAEAAGWAGAALAGGATLAEEAGGGEAPRAAGSAAVPDERDDAEPAPDGAEHALDTWPDGEDTETVAFPLGGAPGAEPDADHAFETGADGEDEETVEIPRGDAVQHREHDFDAPADAEPERAIDAEPARDASEHAPDTGADSEDEDTVEIPGGDAAGAVAEELPGQPEDGPAAPSTAEAEVLPAEDEIGVPGDRPGRMQAAPGSDRLFAGRNEDREAPGAIPDAEPAPAAAVEEAELSQGPRDGERDAAADSSGLAAVDLAFDDHAPGEAGEPVAEGEDAGKRDTPDSGDASEPDLQDAAETAQWTPGGAEIDPLAGPSVFGGPEGAGLEGGPETRAETSELFGGGSVAPGGPVNIFGPPDDAPGEAPSPGLGALQGDLPDPPPMAGPGAPQDDDPESAQEGAPHREPLRADPAEAEPDAPDPAADMPAAGRAPAPWEQTVIVPPPPPPRAASAGAGEAPETGGAAVEETATPDTSDTNRPAPAPGSHRETEPEINIFGDPQPEPPRAPEPSAEVNIFGAPEDDGPVESAPAGDGETATGPAPEELRRRLFGGGQGARPAPAPRWIEDPNEPAPAPVEGGSRLESVMARYRETRDTAADPAPPADAGRDAPDAGEAWADGPAVEPGELAARANAATVPELLTVAAAWLTLVDRRSSFGRREVMEIFDQLPGDHPRTLEARIKGFGKLVRAGALVLVDDGRFALGPEERDRFRELIG
jgi:hypothetical protein